MGDEDGVDQVKMEDNGILALGGGRTRDDIGGLVVSSSKPSAGFGGFVLKNIGVVCWFGP
jgi:hypothetical protein